LIELLLVMKLSLLVFWVVMPCGLAGRYKRFGGIYCLHLQSMMEAVCSSERNVGIYLQVHTTLQTRKPTLTVPKLIIHIVITVLMYHKIWGLMKCNSCITCFCRRYFNNVSICMQHKNLNNKCEVIVLLPDILHLQRPCIWFCYIFLLFSMLPKLFNV
jgi:hypothetical protein